MRYKQSKYESDYIKGILNEAYRGSIKGQKPQIVKLSCHPDISVQITKPEDQIIVCPRCFKRNLLTWSKREAGIKIGLK